MIELKGKTAATWSHGIHRSPTLARILQLGDLKYRPRRLAGVDVIIGWGIKPNTRRARDAASQAGLPFVAIEDGFLRSWRPGVAGDPPLSLVADDLGIYYDATCHSRLESIINEGIAVTEQDRQLQQRFVAGGYAKYNNAVEPLSGLDQDRPVVLVIDQTAGDMSIEYGDAAASSFREMLEAALDENPDARILVKTHPDVLTGRRRGHFGKLPDDPRLLPFSAPVANSALLDAVQKVYAVTSNLGFEALLRGLPVRCFGMPWYAGWGLTEDEKVCERRRARPDATQLFTAAYLRYSSCFDPFTHQPGRLDHVMDWIDLQRGQARGRTGPSLCIGFRAWKRGHLKNFVGHAGSELTVRRDASGIKPDDLQHYARVVVWGSRETPVLERQCREQGKPWLRMEDGFLRSVGLGSDFVRPASLVFDDLGMYYDPRRPSRLERILQAGGFEEGLLRRSAGIIEQIRENGISKYNLGNRDAEAFSAPAGKKKILVVGQVEDDASIRLGCPGVRTNLALLERVRGENPAAFIVYKPHPDVIAGNRRGRVSRRDSRRICDHVVEETDIHSCIGQVDELQVLTSLAGFEALILGKPVVTHGQPFFASWGLTDDRIPLTRRERKCSLEELVAATLLLYPCYYDWTLRGFTTPEAVMAHLIEQRDRSGSRIRATRLQRWRNKLVNLRAGLGRG